MTLQTLLRKENNNLDIFRLIAACMVTYGHDYAIVPASGSIDIVYRMLGFDYSGSLAVKIFFFLSGLVVTNSLLTKNDPAAFAMARFFRIWPALTATVVLTVLILGPLGTSLPLGEYFGTRDTWSYISSNLAMRIQFNLPGVFTGSHYPGVLNGSFWTIPYEVAAYLILLALSMLRLLRSKIVVIALFILITTDPLLGNKILFTWLSANHEIDLLAPCFAFGAILAVYKDHFVIDGNLTLGSWIMFYLFRHHTVNFYFFYFALFLSILYLSRLNMLLKVKPRSDISYGIYLWGFPVQQTIAWIYPGQSVPVNQAASILIAILFGLMSWHLLEKHCIDLGRQMIQKRRSMLACSG